MLADLHGGFFGGRHPDFGMGPGAEESVSLQLKKKQHTLVLLAENLGRVSGGRA